MVFSDGGTFMRVGQLTLLNLQFFYMIYENMICLIILIILISI
jgi:hypothetical protein